MNKELRDKIVIAVLTASLTALGFLAKIHYDKKDKKEEFVLGIYKDLFDKGSERLSNLHSAYAELYSLFNKDHALTTFEMEENYAKFVDALSSFAKYVVELERYGSSAQVKSAKNLLSWWRGIHFGFSAQYMKAESVQRRVAELVAIEDTSGEEFKFVNRALNDEIVELMNHENHMYYEVEWRIGPLVNGFEQYLYYIFRQSIGLHATEDMAKIINGMPEIMEKYNAYEWKDKNLPFMFAEQRRMQGPSLEFPEDEFFKYKNDLLKNRARMKFIASVIEHNGGIEAFVEKLKARE